MFNKIFCIVFFFILSGDTCTLSELKKRETSYAVIWEFHVKPGYKEKFIKSNEPGGEWIQLFSQSDGYLGTEILYDLQNKSRIVLIDRWASQQAYEAFRKQHDNDYRILAGL